MSLQRHQPSRGFSHEPWIPAFARVAPGFLAPLAHSVDIPITMPYFECPSCGKTALKVASRCPHCGLIFSPDMIPPPPPSRIPRILVVAGAVAALAALVVLVRNRRETPAPAPVTVVAPSLPAEPPAPAPDSAADSTPPPAAVQAEPAPPPAVVPPAAPPAADLPAAAPTGGQLQRYATTWVNVRARRGPGAEPVRVLDPGEAVLVDSLIGGWYRVVIDGQPIGYVYNSNLSESAP